MACVQCHHTITTAVPRCRTPTCLAAAVMFCAIARWSAHDAAAACAAASNRAPLLLLCICRCAALLTRPAAPPSLLRPTPAHSLALLMVVLIVSSTQLHSYAPLLPLAVAPFPAALPLCWCGSSQSSALTKVSTREDAHMLRNLLPAFALLGRANACGNWWQSEACLADTDPRYDQKASNDLEA